ncbi:discoidin domain-containing protein [Cohnella kolymensis]|uniref:discoidin domain-containing protein n=1 Tax=Cohnella kolymensis TaxID=1590652 RepID=UPI000A5539F7|nr:discoidin domain-containing protein [Cohnella kolymensis]
MFYRTSGKILPVAVCIALISGILYVPADRTASAANDGSDFYSSFETGDPQVTWESTVETDAQGNQLSSGVDGNAPFTGIPGSITHKVVEAKARGENTGAGEVAGNLVDSDSNSKWLDFNSTSWVQFKLSEPAAVVKYALTSANDAPGRDPRNWTFEGSDDGQTWTVVDTRTNQTSAGASSQTYMTSPMTKRSCTTVLISH